MGDPTNRNDPEYSNNPNYAWSGGRWQYGTDPNKKPNTDVTSVNAETIGSVGGLYGGIRPGGVGTGGGTIRNEQAWQDAMRAGLTAPPRANPYNTQQADQSRAGQLALFQQMQAQRAGPSIAAMQAGGAQGQNVQAALAAGRGGNVGRMAAGAAGGMGSAAGQAVLAEQLRASQGAGGLAGNLRGNDINSANQQSAAVLKQQGMDDALRQFYAQQGAKLGITGRANALENDKLLERLRKAGRDGNAQASGDIASVLRGIVSTVAGMG